MGNQERNEKPKLLDTCCGGGGASLGYHQAGFDVVGVDIEPQPNYPFEFHRADALEFVDAWGWRFDAYHASTPCHDWSDLSALSGLDGSAWLLDEVRSRFVATGKPYVLENVEGAPMP